MSYYIPPELAGQRFIEFKYEGDSHFIDINTLLASQFHFTALVSEVKQELYPTVDLKIKVEAFEKGSFDINQLFEIATVSGLFALENIDYVFNILSTVGDIISIKQFLKGDKATKVSKPKNGNVTINIKVDGKNNSLTITENAFKIYTTNVVIDEAIRKEAQALVKDEEISGISILDRKTGKDLIKINRDDFDNLTGSNPYLDDEVKEVRKDAVLGIFKWETIPKKGAKWAFIYEHRKINQVVIKDEKFLKEVLEKRYRFGAGDSLNVELLIKMKKDEGSGYYLEDKFEIVKVHNIVWRDKQSEIEFEK